MAHTSYSPYPSVDSASDYTPEPAQTPSTTKRRARGSMTAEERREARAHRNRLAAQCSRDRKKAQFEALTTRVTQLEEENRSLRLGLVQQQPQPTLSSSATNAELVKENQELRGRIQQLELAWQNMTKILGAMSIPLPPSFNAEVESQRQPVLSRTSNDTITSMPLSPAPTASPKSEPVEEPNVSSTEPTCELARGVPAAGGTLGAIFGSSPIIGTDPVGKTTTTTATPSPMFPTSTTSGRWNERGLLLSDPLATPLDEGYNEMERLLDLLPTPQTALSSQALDIGLSSLLGTTGNDDWSWLNENNF